MTEEKIDVLVMSCVIMLFAGIIGVLIFGNVLVSSILVLIALVIMVVGGIVRGKKEVRKDDDGRILG